MRSVEALEALAFPLRVRLTFEEKVILAELIGLVPAYCTECNCTLGSPVCHPLPQIVDNDNDPQTTGCPSPCHAED